MNPSFRSEITQGQQSDLADLRVWLSFRLPEIEARARRADEQDLKTSLSSSLSEVRRRYALGLRHEAERLTRGVAALDAVLAGRLSAAEVA